jgi:glycerophosphoryl diester phosphodiesterase
MYKIKKQFFNKNTKSRFNPNQSNKWGFSIKPQPAGKDFKAIVRIKTRDKVLTCSSSIGVNLTIYEAYTEKSTDSESEFNSEGYTRNIDKSKNCWRPSSNFFDQNIHLSNSVGFTNKHIYVVNVAVHKANYWPTEKIWGGWLDFSVTVELELKGIKLTDIRKINLPGIGIIDPKEFAYKTEYPEGHACSKTNRARSGKKTLCSNLDAIRYIPDPNKKDFIIQAHRGIWGKSGGIQENTKEAMDQAIDFGIKLLESDIMPIGVSNIDYPYEPEFAEPSNLACFHDFVLERLTDQSSGFIYDLDVDGVKQINLKKPRSEKVGTQKVLLFTELVDIAVNKDVIVCVDMKNLEPKGKGLNCEYLCDFQKLERKKKSLYANLKWAINNIRSSSDLAHLAIKTYAGYEELKENLTTGSNAISDEQFNQVLWAPMIAPNNQWEIEQDGNTIYDPNKITEFIDGWIQHNESVLYYEINFFNTTDSKSAVFLQDSYSFINSQGDQQKGNLVQYITNYTGRRPGIFSEEPVGGKGTVNRWGKWKIKNTEGDRRGDHLWLLNQKGFNNAVITTDRPDIWQQLNDID